MVGVLMATNASHSIWGEGGGEGGGEGDIVCEGVCVRVWSSPDHQLKEHRLKYH